jgi:hypothetical protein
MERVPRTTMETFTYDDFTDEDLAMMESINLDYEDEDEDEEIEPCHWYVTPGFDSSDEI